MDKYLTIPKLARKLDVSGNTVRRHIRNYARFFRSELVDSYEQFPEEQTMEVLKAIIKISTAGKRKADVIAELQKMEFEEVRSVEAEESGYDLESGAVEVGPETMTLLRSIASSLEKIAEKA